MLLSYSPDALWCGKGCFNTPPSTQSEPKQRRGHIKASCPSGNAQRLAFVGNKFLSGFIHSVSGVRFGGERIFNAPSAPQSPRKIACAQAKLSGPFRYVLCLAFKANVFVRRYVRLLLFRCCPSAIFRRVIRCTINSVNCHSFWPLSHVREEVLKRIAPSLAYANSLGSVLGEFIGALVVAPSKHVVVGGVRRALCVLCRVSVLCFWHDVMCVNDVRANCNRKSLTKRRNRETQLCMRGFA